MEINSSSLRLALLVILVKIILKFSWLISFVSFLQIEELPFNIDSFINILSLFVDLYLTYYFLIFLNQYLSFKKANLILWVLIAVDILHMFYLFFITPEAVDFRQMNVTSYYMIVQGAVITITKIILAFRVLKYRGAFRSQVILYAVSIWSIIIFQLLLIPLASMLPMASYSYTKYLSQLTSLFPTAAMFLLFYKALKKPALLNENDSPDVLDGREFSI